MLHIQNRMGSTIAVIGEYYNDIHKMILASGTSSYEFTVSKSDPDQESIVVGNYVVMLDDEHVAHQFTIIKVEQTHNEKVVYCEDASLELLNKQRDAWIKPATAQKAEYYANKALDGTGWTIGINEIPSLKRTLEWTGQDTALKRILSIATQFDNAELDFHVEFNMMNVTKKVVDIKKRVGANRPDIELVYGDNVTEIKKTETMENLATALIGVGSQIENTGTDTVPSKNFDFSSIVYDDGDYYTTKGDTKVYARTANNQFNLGKSFIEQFYNYDTKSPQELFNRALSQLKKRAQPTLTYDVSLADVGITTLSKGDTVTIIDDTYNPQLLLSARVLELNKSYTNPSKNTAKFGNFVTLQTSIVQKLIDLQNKLKTVQTTPGSPGADGKTSYFHTAWADDVSGTTGFTTSGGDGKKYIGTYADLTKADSEDPSKYKWALFKGEDGQDGQDGQPGKDGTGIKTTVVRYQASSSGTTQPTGIWSSTVPAVIKGQYLWTRTDWTYTDNSTETGYSVSYIAKDGNNGTNGVAGKDGVGIKTTTITYTSSSSGTTAPTSGWTANPPATSAGHYIWTKTVWAYTDGTSETGYSVGKSGDVGPKGDTGDRGLQGLQGATGNQGIQGPKGADGKSSYTHIAYADNVSGTKDFSVDDPIGRSYMGVYSDFTKADSTNPSDYIWSYTKGETGPEGKDGADGKDGEPGSKDVPVTTVSAAQPATAKDGDIWWVLNSTDVATAMKVYTSGAWVDKKVDQSVLNIVTLNAVTINGSTINGSNINISYTGTLSDGQQGSSQQILDNTGYSQTSTLSWFSSPIVTRSEIDNIGRFTTGFSNQSEYNPSQPWANTLGQINIDPVNLYIGFTATDLSGNYYLSVQDAYQNSGYATYLNGWGSWHADYSLKVVRKGRMVTVWGYIKHNNSATITPFAQVPAWARPQQGIVISAVTFNSSVGNPIASGLVMNADTGKIGFNSGGQKGGYVCFSTTYVGGDV